MDILERPDDDPDPVEPKDLYVDFPHQQDYKTLSEEEPLALVTWIATHFLHHCIPKTVLPRRDTWPETPIQLYATPQDFALACVAVENGINKWERVHMRIQSELPNYTKEDLKTLPGTKYNSLGISSDEGKKRFQALTNQFHKEFYANTSHARANMFLLNKRACEALTAKLEDHTIAPALPPKKKAKTSPDSIDPEFDRMQALGLRQLLMNGEFNYTAIALEDSDISSASSDMTADGSSAQQFAV